MAEPLHRFAVVILVAFTPAVGPYEPGGAWIRGTQQVRADLRAREIAVITAGYIRHLGYDAVAHSATATDLDLNRVALQCGLAEIRGEQLVNPYLPGGFGLAAVSTDLPIAPDHPLARRGPAERWQSHGPHWGLGIGGTKPGWKWLDGGNRPMHMGPYPMEKIKPFVGPRFKLVVTTDMPLKADKPIDFGLQDFCNQCNKSARECPCGAISFGDKVMFNGYEMWKRMSKNA